MCECVREGGGGIQVESEGAGGLGRRWGVGVRTWV